MVKKLIPFDNQHFGLSNPKACVEKNIGNLNSPSLPTTLGHNTFCHKIWNVTYRCSVYEFEQFTYSGVH